MNLKAIMADIERAIKPHLPVGVAVCVTNADRTISNGNEYLDVKIVFSSGVSTQGGRVMVTSEGCIIHHPACVANKRRGCNAPHYAKRCIHYTQGYNAGQNAARAPRVPAPPPMIATALGPAYPKANRCGACQGGGKVPGRNEYEVDTCGECGGAGWRPVTADAKPQGATLAPWLTAI